MSFWICYYHLIWTTKYRIPSITPEVERIVIDAIVRRSAILESTIHAVNTASDHVHVAVSIPPKRAAAEWVQQVKGLSAWEVNRQLPQIDPLFKWQTGYAVLTFGAKNLPFVVNYIERQKEHHQCHQLEPYLEQVDEDND